MQCPFCGSDGLAGDVVFCPHCRYQFRPVDPVAGEESRDSGVLPVQDYCGAPPGPEPEGEARIPEVLLIQPAILFMIFIAVVVYTVIGSLPAFGVRIAGSVVNMAGLVCLLTGAISAWAFYRLMLARLR